MSKNYLTIDANEATANIAYRTNEVIAIYPITPSSGMGELSDSWASENKPNIWGTVPLVMEMQSEGGAAGAVHGSLQAGALTTTFTASQGLLLMIPNMFKIAGELTSTVFHVSARALSYQAISIYGDHSDVMATRMTGFAMMASRSVQEAHDMALICQAATMESRVPFLHFFDGFRTSHEESKIEIISDETIRAIIDEKALTAIRERRLNPENPFIRGTLQNWDVYFQGRESVNTHYAKCPEIVQNVMDRFYKETGRQYHLFDYKGAPDAERILILMGSGAETAEETALFLANQGEKVGVVTVHLYRPFSAAALLKAIPSTVKSIAVLDRTKEAGSQGEPLYQDVLCAVTEGVSKKSAPFTSMPTVIRGRYGLASKEFTPGMAKSVFDELKKASPKEQFTTGIVDDVTHTSLNYDPTFSIESSDTVRCVFFGLGADGTVGANKNSIKIIGEETDNFAQAYFVYDSKKSGSVTVSHLRFGPKPIRAPYLVGEGDATFVACHNYSFIEKYDMLKFAKKGSVFLLNSLFGVDEIWDQLPVEMQEDMIRKEIQFYIIDAHKIAQATGMGSRINTIMQTCFFAISGILPRDEAIKQIKKSIQKTYGKRGESVVQMNWDAVDKTIANLYKVNYPAKVTSKVYRRQAVSDKAPKYVKDVLGKILVFEGDSLPVSKMSTDGTYPSGTSQWEKRNIALEIPVWKKEICIQCGKCALVCPHAAIRLKVYDPSYLEKAPATFKSIDAKFPEYPGTKFTVQVAPEDCTGCGICVEACPAKDKTQVSLKAINMADQLPIRDQESVNWDYFLSLPDPDRSQISNISVKTSQLLRPLFEFSGACSGCGETPYVKLLSQLFGDRMLVANATGCSSVYGGSLPTTPWAKNSEGKGPGWSNSLFEDNAEFGLGMQLASEKQQEYAKELLKKCSPALGDTLVNDILQADQTTEAGIQAQRKRVQELKSKLKGMDDAISKRLYDIADAFIRRSIWILGGDGWAYDIGYGGLDHVIASGRNVNILVLDTEVYSNTGGQASKSTPRAAVAKFASSGKGVMKKDLGMIAMSYGYVYVARVAFGANDNQTLRAFKEADAYNGPSLIIAYSHCISHGINMKNGINQQKLAVQAGVWPLYRYNPDLLLEGKPALTIDSKAPSIPVEEYAYQEGRYSMLVKANEARAEELMKKANMDVKKNWEKLMHLSTFVEPTTTDKP